MDAIKTGLQGEQVTTVTEALTARHLGSGGIEVYATPAMAALMEAAAVAAIEPLLAEGQASVGIALNIQHLAATPIGHTIRAQAEVAAVDGRRIIFQVKAWDEAELIGRGEHVRYIIDRSRFVERVMTKVK
jgi:predicted thioesterase